MSKRKLIAVSLVCSAIAMFELQQVAEACRCMCHAVSGLPDEVDVDVAGTCDRDFAYTYSVHVATDNDDCGSGISGSAAAYTAGASVNVQNHIISPTTFTVSGAGHTEEFTVSGNLANDNLDGVSASFVQVNNFQCDTGTLSVDVKHDEDCD